MEDTKTLKKSRGEKFVEYVLGRIKYDNAFRAAMCRADNPDTEYQAWEYLAHWCDIDNDWERRPYALIGAAIARAKPDKDGYFRVGRAIAECYEERNKSDSAKTKLRRLLACNSVREACLVLRPLITLIVSHGVHVNFGQLLNDLLYFKDGEKTKVQWAVDFYGRRENDSITA